MKDLLELKIALIFIGVLFKIGVIAGGFFAIAQNDVTSNSMTVMVVVVLFKIGGYARGFFAVAQNDVTSNSLTVVVNYYRSE